MFQQATLENYGQAEMPEWDDQASKHQCCKNENNCQWKSIFWKWNFLERTYRNTHKTRTFFLPCNALKIWHDLEIFVFNLKKGTLKFLLNTLPTQTNLLQWGKSASDLCKLCLQAGAELQGRRQETTNYILNGCKGAVHQKRYTWRHNNLIKYITG